MRISDWSSDVCSSDLAPTPAQPSTEAPAGKMTQEQIAAFNQAVADFTAGQQLQKAANNAGVIAKYEGALPEIRTAVKVQTNNMDYVSFLANTLYADAAEQEAVQNFDAVLSVYQEALQRSEEHTTELQSLIRTSYAVLCVNKQIRQNN